MTQGTKGGQRDRTDGPIRPIGAVDRVAVALATALGVGYAPIAPGTFGTAAAVPMAWALAGVSLWAYAAVCAGVTVVAIWAAGRAERAFGQHDSGRIVIDEVAGFLCTMAPVDRSRWVLLAAGFVLFRAADVLKPPPARQIDRGLGGGAGVVLDDVAAGVWAALALWLLARFVV